MSAPSPPRRRLLPLLITANLLVVLGIVAVLLRPDREPSWIQGPEDGAVPWSDRFAPSADELPDCPDCSVLMISLDIFRPDHMPCFGYARETTPNICAMAEQGTLFERFIVHAYQTPVSQMSIFTGRYPSSSGYVSFSSRLSPTVGTMPEVLQAQGYHTVAMGSSFEVMTDMSSNQVGRVKFHRDGLNPGINFGRGFDRFVFTGNRNLPTDAIPWLQEHGEDRFFLWLILGTLHWPYGTRGDPALADMYDPPGYDGPLADLERIGFEQVSRMYQGTLYDDETGATTPLGPEDVAYINARYDFGLWTVDRFIGDLMAAIPPEQLKKTIIVLHGVHGEDLGEHGYFGHYDVYDTEVSSTLLVLNPGHRVQGVRVKEQVEGVDLAPTLLEVLGLPPLNEPDGGSFVEVLRTGRGDPERRAFTERIPLWEDIFRHRSQMPPEYVGMINGIMDGVLVGDTGLRTNRWKLLHRRARQLEQVVSWWTYLSGQVVARPEWELYDLEADPDELTNVLDQHPEVAAELQAELLAWEQRVATRQREAVAGGWGDPRLSADEPSDPAP